MKSERGYNMVVLVMAVTVLNILVAAALPYWSTAVKRAKEEELIFRGLQYAEGIRVFQNRFGRLPVRLEELMEVEPRCMRQLYPDPMTEDGKWGLLFATAGNPQIGPDGRPVQQGGPGTPPQPGQGAQPPPAPGPDGEPAPQPGQDLTGGSGLPDGTLGVAGSGDPDEVTIGPIQGVFSRSDEESMLVWNGEEQYNRWHFTLHLVSGQFQAPAGVPAVPGSSVNPGPGVPVLSLRWVGRPLPPDIQLPGGPAPGGENLRPDGRRRTLPNTLDPPPPTQGRPDGGAGS